MWKVAGPDGLINEVFKYFRNVIAKVLSKLFNIILLSGSVPKEWADGWIVPIYKKKGSQLDPNNYRGISLYQHNWYNIYQCTLFCESVELLGNEQGFSDHIFALYALNSIYTKFAERKLYCCFVDYKKAFDSVPRVHLWCKLLSYDINGKVLNVIKSFYGSAKSVVYDCLRYI